MPEEIKCPVGHNGKPLLKPSIWKILSRDVKSVICTLAAENEVIHAEDAALKKRIEELEEKLRASSRNSSKPPSSDPPDKKDNKKKKKGKGKKRRPGGQPGHEAHTRELLPPEEVDKFVRCDPVKQCDCGGEVEVDEEQEAQHLQTLEIPSLKPYVSQYDQYFGICCRCGKHHPGKLPEGVGEDMLGPRAKAIVSILSGKYHLSKRGIQEIMHDFFGIELSLGSVSNTEARVSDALAEPVEEAKEHVKDQKVANLDESGWREKKKRAWLWVAVTTAVTVFIIRCSRGAKVARELLGEDPGIVISDRFSAYNYLDPQGRQLCWAHLERDFIKLMERGGASEGIGEALLEYSDSMFKWWHRVRDGTMSRKKFAKKMEPVRRKVEALLEYGTVCGHSKTQETCKEILKVRDALWTFIDVRGVEPTNNAAERAIRPAVLWRKRSFGTESQRGSLFVERMMTVGATCKQQDRNVLDYVTCAIKAHMNHRQAPSLVPGQQLVQIPLAA